MVENDESTPVEADMMCSDGARSPEWPIGKAEGLAPRDGDGVSGLGVLRWEVGCTGDSAFDTVFTEEEKRMGTGVGGDCRAIGFTPLVFAGDVFAAVDGEGAPAPSGDESCMLSSDALTFEGCTRVSGIAACSTCQGARHHTMAVLAESPMADDSAAADAADSPTGAADSPTEAPSRATIPELHVRNDASGVSVVLAPAIDCTREKKIALLATLSARVSASATGLEGRRCAPVSRPDGWGFCCCAWEDVLVFVFVR